MPLIRSLRGQKLGDVVAGTAEAVGVRREAVGAPEHAVPLDEDVGRLDHVALDPPGDRHDLPHATDSVVLEGGMDDEVDRPGDGRDDEPASHLVTPEGRPADGKSYDYINA